MFALEALQADHGDSLLLRFGPTGDRLIVIDGGPSGIYRRSLQPRLNQLRNGRDAGEPLVIDRVFVSHMDDDHIQGLLDLFDELISDDESRLPPPWVIDGLWLNEFDLAKLGIAEPTALTAAVASIDGAGVAGVGGRSDAVIASIPQARDLSRAATRLSIPENADFASGLAMATPTGPVVTDLDGELTLTVVGPHEDRIEDLRKRWEAYVKAHQAKAPPDEVATAALAVDRSVYNLSSTIVLAERGGRSMLLTGDGLGEDILEDLNGAGRLTDGALHVDLLKMPHHGSIRNVSKPADLLRRITADHYVFSANGKFGNPDPPTIQALVEARGTAEYTMHFTNPDDRIDAVLKADRDQHKRHYDVEVRHPAALGLTVELQAAGPA
jgi:ribonuclease BN (tRNA processing enzyme)